MWSIKVFGYRSFADRVPLEIDLTQPVTAIVGANNSGKSNVLRFFWEIGPILRPNLHALIVDAEGSNLPTNPFGNIRAVTSASGVFNQNIEHCPITIELKYMGQLDINNLPPDNWLRHASPLKARIQVKRNNTVVAQIWHHSKWVTPLKNEFQFRQFEDNFFYHTNDQSFACFYKNSDLNCFDQVFFLPALRSSQYVEHNATFNMNLGNHLVAFWKRTKGATDSATRRIAENIERELANIFEYKSLRIDVDDKNTDYIVAVDNRPSIMLKEMGEGFGHFFTVLLNLYGYKRLLSLIDEPETSLHASLQQALMKLISDNTNGPVIFTTHSVGLARAVADKIISIKQENGISFARDFASARNPLELIGEITFSAWRDVGCKGVLFVEGPNDTRICREWMRLLGKGQEWVILPIGGSTTIDALGCEAIAQIINLYPNVAVMIDSERAALDEPLEAKRQEFLDGCIRVGIKCLATSRRSTDTYLSQISIEKAFGSNAKALGHYEKLADHGWSKKHGYKAAQLMELGEIENTDVGMFLLSL